MSRQKNPLAKAHALLLQGANIRGDESKINVVYGKLQKSLFAGGAMTAKFTPEGTCLAGEGWNVKPEVFSAICTEFSEVFVEAIVKSS